MGKVFAAALLANVFSAQISWGAPCALETPVYIGTDNPVLHPIDYNASLVTLTDVEFDKPYLTRAIPQPSPDHKLEIQFFELLFAPPGTDTHTATGWLGAFLYRSDNIWRNVGFSYGYVGNWVLNGDITTDNGVITYMTSEIGYSTIPGSDPATTRITIQVRERHLLALEMTFPIRDYIEQDDGTVFLPYSGKNETLCLRAASLKP